jgi:hypothetical protein
LDHPTKKWCCTTKDCDVNLKWGECPTSQDIAPDTHNCTNGYTSVDSGKNCYKVYNNRKTWFNANSYCRNVDNANLVSITDQFESALIHLLTVSKTSGDPWIGLTTFAGDLTWTWTDGRRNTFTNWGNITGITEIFSKCVYVQDSDGKWSATSCADKKPFICKISKEPIPMVPVIPNGYCEGDGWRERGNKCFKAVLNYYKSFQEAKADCQDQS